MAGPAYYSATLNIAKNEDWTVPFVYSSIAADGVTMIPIDLTGSMLRLQLRRREAEHAAVVNVTSPNGGITITDAVHGAFTIVILRSQLVNVVVGDYVTDLVREMTTGLYERIFEGVATVVEGTTR